MSKVAIDSYAIVSCDGRGPTPLQVLTEWPELYSPPTTIHIGRGYVWRVYPWSARRERNIAAAWRSTRRGRDYIAGRPNEWSYVYQEAPQ